MSMKHRTIKVTKTTATFTADGGRYDVSYDDDDDDDDDDDPLAVPLDYNKTARHSS
jgi:hypothetical protein